MAGLLNTLKFVHKISEDVIEFIVEVSTVLWDVDIVVLEIFAVALNG